MNSHITTTHLFTKSLQDKDVSYLRRINPVMLIDETDAFIYSTIMDYMSKYHSVPSIDVVQEETGYRFIPVDSNYDLGYIFDKVTYLLRTNYIKSRFNDTNFPFDPDFLKELIDDTTISVSNSLLYNEVLPESYFTEQVTLSSNLPFITENIGKIVGSDFVVIVGRMKHQKTHISRVILLDLLLKGYNGILFTNEITALEYSAQLDAIIAGTLEGKGFNPNVFRTLNETEKIRDSLKSVSEFKKKHLGKLHIAGKIKDVDTIYSIVKQVPFKPDFIIIDGVHIMGTRVSSSGDKAQSLRNVSNGLKVAAVELNIPIIGISQSNRSRQGKTTPDSTTIGLTDAIAQDATIVFDSNVENSDGLGPNTTIVKLTPIVNRAGGNKEYYITTDWDTMRISYSEHVDQAGLDTFLDDIDDEEVRV